MSAIKRYIDELVEKGELDPVTLEPISKEEKEKNQSDFEEVYRILREEEEMMYWYWYMQNDEQR